LSLEKLDVPTGKGGEPPLVLGKKKANRELWWVVRIVKGGDARETQEGDSKVVYLAKKKLRPKPTVGRESLTNRKPVRLWGTTGIER